MTNGNSTTAQRFSCVERERMASAPASSPATRTAATTRGVARLCADADTLLPAGCGCECSCCWWEGMATVAGLV